MNLRRWSGAILLPLAALAMLAAPAGPARADDRADHPYQLQLDAGGLSVGYHLGRRLYIGFTGQPTYHFGRSYNTNHWDDAEIYGQDGVRHYEQTQAQRNSVEVRFTPWNFGMYFALGSLSTGTASQKITYDTRERDIGGGTYTTGLKVRVREAPQDTGAAGIGYVHVFRSGLSLTGGALVGWNPPPDPDVTVTDLSGTVTQSDLDRFRHRIERQNRGVRGMLHLAVGWNF